MSELSQDAERHLSPELQELYVSRLIEALRDVATGDRTVEFTELPVLFEENIELAHLITDAEEQARVPYSQGQIVYHRGQYHGENVEFATRYEGEDKLRLVAWGVRKPPVDFIKNPHRAAIKMPAAALDTFVVEILDLVDDQGVTSEPYLRMAA